MRNLWELSILAVVGLFLGVPTSQPIGSTCDPNSPPAK
jgi:hypothetical protein